MKVINNNQIEFKAIRDGFGEGLIKLGKTNSKVVVLTCDLTESTRSLGFANQFPNRFIEVGVAEQNMIGLASGLAHEGLVPFCSSYAVFSPGRNWDQIRVSVCYSKSNVKIIGAHAGISVGPDGATHQAMEDLALMRVLPNMTVIVPADANEAFLATVALAKHKGPGYLRTYREKTPVFTDLDKEFKIGRAEVLRKGKDVTIAACGPQVYYALEAAEILAKKKIECEVINFSTIKPLDEETLLASVKKTKKIVSAEEHQVTGGLGSAISEVLVKKYPVRQEFVGMPDKFGESGTPEELIKKWGMDSEAIIVKIKKLLNK